MMSLRDLIEGYANPGQVMWLGIRPERRVPMRVVSSVRISENGIEGDHRQKPGKRAVSLIQWEHVPVIAALVGRAELAPDLLRRNIAIAGINVLGLRNQTFRMGSVILRGTGVCAPCSRMEEALGKGGYAAVRGHGGITADIITPGDVGIGDRVIPCADGDLR
mgnify:FL=1